MHSTKHKIAYCYSTFQLGGVQKRLLLQLSQPEFANHHHVFIAREGKCDIEKFFPSGLSYEVIPFEERKSLAQRYFQMRKLLKKIKPDIMITNNWGSIEWSLANFPRLVPKFIHLEEGFGPDEVGKLKLHRNIFRSIVFHFIDHVIVPSQNLMKIAQRFWKISEPRLLYLPNGIETELYQDKIKSRKALLELINIKEDSKKPLFFYGTVCGLRPEKNLTRMVEIFETLALEDSSAHLVILGEGKERKIIEQLILRKNLQGKIHLPGFVASPQDIIPGFDLFLMTSDTEQMPICLLEAMASKVPFASTDVGDIKFIVSEENRPFIVPKNQVDRLVQQIKKLRVDTKIQNHVTKANFEIVHKEYSLKDYIQKFSQLLFD